MRFDTHIQAYKFNQQRLAQMSKFIDAVANPAFAYSRARPICGTYVVTAYLRNAQSPTGIQAEASCDMEDAVKIMDAFGRPFPLSPTEGLNKSGANASY